MSKITMKLAKMFSNLWNGRSLRSDLNLEFENIRSEITEAWNNRSPKIYYCSPGFRRIDGISEFLKLPIGN